MMSTLHSLSSSRLQVAFCSLLVLCCAVSPTLAAKTQRGAGGWLERVVVVGDYLYQPQGRTINTWRLEPSGAPVLESISPVLGGTVTGLTSLDGALYVSWRNQNLQGGVTRLSLADPDRPVPAGDLSYGSKAFRDPESIAAVGHLLYVADAEAGGVFILDPAGPPSGSPTLLFTADEMEVDGTRLVAWSDNIPGLGGISVEILDVTDPAQPVVVGSFSRSLFAYRATVDGDLLALADDGLRLYDLSDPTMPTIVYSQPSTTVPAASFFHLDGTALYLGGIDTLLAWDVSTPSAPVEVTSLPIPPTGAAIAPSRPRCRAGVPMSCAGEGLTSSIWQIQRRHCASGAMSIRSPRSLTAVSWSMAAGRTAASSAACGFST